MQILYYVPVPGLYLAAAANIGPVQVRYGQRSVEDWPVGSLRMMGLLSLQFLSTRKKKCIYEIMMWLRLE